LPTTSSSGALSRGRSGRPRGSTGNSSFPAIPVLPPNPVGPFIINGRTNFVSEVSNVGELGYRAQIAKVASVSLTAFHTVHDKLRSGEPAPAQVQNGASGYTDGVEGWGTYQASRDWRLMIGFSELRQHLKAAPATRPGTSAQGNDPEHQQMLRSLFNLTERHELDFIVRHVSALPNPVVPAYTAVDGAIRLEGAPRPRAVARRAEPVRRRPRRVRRGARRKRDPRAWAAQGGLAARPVTCP